MTKTRLMVLAVFVVAFGAGLVLGVAGPKRLTGLVDRLIHPGGSDNTTAVQPALRDQHRPTLTEILKLNKQQEQQIAKIWDEARKQAGIERQQREDRRRELRDERENAVLAMIPPAQRDAYEKVKLEFTEKFNQLDRERIKAFEKAVEQTRQLLTEQQRLEYEKFMKDRDQARRRGGPGRRGEQSATTRPALTQPSR